MWMSHVTCKSVMSRMFMCRVTCVWVASHMNNASRIWISHSSCCNGSQHAARRMRRCLMAHLWMSHVSHVNESYHLCQCIMPHVCMSRVTCLWVESHMNKSIYQWMSCGLYFNGSRRAGSQIRRSHVTHVNESCHTCEWVMSRMWISHLTHAHESWHMCMSRVTCEWVM